MIYLCQCRTGMWIRMQNARCSSFIVASISITEPHFVHFLVMVFDITLNDQYLTIFQQASVLNIGAAIASYKNLADPASVIL